MRRQTVRGLLSLSLCLLLLLSPFSALNSYAETLDSEEFTYKCTQFYKNGTHQDVTSNVSVNTYTEDGERVVFFSMPSGNNLDFQLLVCYAVPNLRVGREYDMSFGFALGHQSAADFIVNLVFYDGNGQLIKTQQLYHNTPNSLNVLKHINVSFVPDATGVTSAYYTELQFQFYSSTDYSNTAKLTKDINIRDVSDNTGFFEGIFNWLSAIYHSIVGGEDSQGNVYDGIVQGIKNGLITLGNTFSQAFSDVGQSITNKLNDVKDGINNTLNSVKNAITNKIDNISIWLHNLGEDIIEGIKSLFIPSEGFYEGIKNRFSEWAEAHLGFIYTLGSLVTGLITSIRDMLTDDFQFILPAARVKLPNNDFYLWEEQVVDISAVMNLPAIHTLYGLYKAFIGVILSFALYQYGTKIYNKIMSN